MLNRWLFGPLRDKAGDAEGTATVDPGAPFVHGDPPDKPAPKTPEKSNVDKRLEELESENKRLGTRLSEAENDAKYWSQRARGERQPEPEPESDDEPAPARAEEVDISPEEFLDVLSKEGIKGLRRFGFMTKADVDAEVARIREESDRKLAQSNHNTSIDNRLSTEFPELVEDNRRVQRGEKPQSELFTRAAAEYRQMIEDDPG